MSTMSGDQGMLSSFIAIFALMAGAPLAALMLLGGGLSEVSQAQVQAVRQSLPAPASAARQAGAAPAIEWLRPDRVHVPSGLAISGHAAGHNGEAERLYWLLVQGQCVTAAKFCGGSKIEKMYACVDPITGIVGAILQFGDEITTGYFERDGSGYWTKRVERENWEVCK